MSETQLVTAALDYLKAAGIFAARNNTGVRGGIRFGLGKGSADIIAVVSGRMVALEAKVDRGVVSQDQLDWMKRVKAAGAYYAVIRSIDDVRAAIAAAKETA